MIPELRILPLSCLHYQNISLYLSHKKHMVISTMVESDPKILKSFLAIRIPYVINLTKDLNIKVQ